MNYAYRVIKVSNSFNMHELTHHVSLMSVVNIIHFEPKVGSVGLPDGSPNDLL